MEVWLLPDLAVALVVTVGPECWEVWPDSAVTPVVSVRTPAAAALAAPPADITPDLHQTTHQIHTGNGLA